MLKCEKKRLSQRSSSNILFFSLLLALFLGCVFRIVRKNAYICPRQTATGVLADKNCDTGRLR